MTNRKPKVNPAEVAARMKTYRQSEGLNQRQLAEQLNTTRGVIGAAERGVIRSMRVAKLALELVVVNPDAVI